MAPAWDDLEITDDRFLLRVLFGRWLTRKEGRERPTSESLMDSNQENSCFIENEITIGELNRIFPGRQIARIPVGLVRQFGYAIERRPDEAPEDCANPNSHVVIGPLRELGKNAYERAAKGIVTSEQIAIIHPLN